MAREKGLQAIAFADHNSVANIQEGLRLSRKFGIEFIPCLELNTFHNDLDLHLLAYYIQPQDPGLIRWLETIERKKKEQAEKRVAKLNELGFVFDWNDLRAFSADHIPTGASFLKAILSRKENAKDPRLRPYVDGHRSASPYVNFYRDYLRGGKPAFVYMEDILTLAAIRQIKELRGIPVLAHPSDTGHENILALIGSGLEGLEVYSPYHDAGEQEAFRVMAERHNLLITAGSDFHGKAIKPDVEFGEVAGNDYDLVNKLKKRLEEI
jgi:predicted metal-dependent phosphoesterase TrpH